jgi:hypothetical protein
VGNHRDDAGVVAPGRDPFVADASEVGVAARVVSTRLGGTAGYEA